MCGSCGADCSNKLLPMRWAFAELPTNSAILDVVFLAFDLLHQDGVDCQVSR